MPRTTMRFLALSAAAVAVAASAGTAAARSTMVDDQSPILRRAVAAGLQVSGDNLWQTRGPEVVLGTAREVESVPSSALVGKSPAAMAAILRTALRASGGHYAVIDDAGPAFRGAQGGGHRGGRRGRGAALVPVAAGGAGAGAGGRAQQQHGRHRGREGRAA